METWKLNIDTDASEATGIWWRGNEGEYGSVSAWEGRWVGGGKWWLGKGRGVDGCLDSAVGASSVKLVNPEEQRISSAGGNRCSRGALGARCPRPRRHAAGLPCWLPSSPSFLPPSKTSPRLCPTQYVETDPHTNPHKYIKDMHCNTPVHYWCGEAGGAEREE